MKKIPKEIYLNIGEISKEQLQDLDFNDLHEVTWSDTRINENDVKFVLSNVVGQSEQLCEKCNREKKLQKLTDQAQELGLGYDD